MRGLTFFLLLCISTISALASVGSIVQMEGKVNIIRNSTEYVGNSGFILEQGDNILTGNLAKARLEFHDKTIINLGRNSDFSVNSYLFDEAKSKFDTKFQIKKGFFRAVTGKIGKVAPQKFQLKAKTATMGIRGTIFSGQIGENAEQFFCTEGAISVTAQGKTIIVKKGFDTLVEYGKPPTPPEPTLPQSLEHIDAETVILQGSSEAVKLEQNDPLSQYQRDSFREFIQEYDADGNPIFTQDYSTFFNNDLSGQTFEDFVQSFEFVDNLPESETLISQLTRESVYIDEDESIIETGDNDVYSQNGKTAGTETGDGSSALYRGVVGIVSTDSSNKVQLFGETSSLPSSGSEFTPSSYYGSIRTLSESDFSDSTGYSYLKWGTWNDTTSSSIAPDFFYPGETLTHHWVIGERSTSLPSSGSGVYAGSMAGNIVGGGSSGSLSGSINMTLDFASRSVSSGSFSLNQSGQSWVSGSVTDGLINQSGNYHQLSSSLSGDSISSGSLLGDFYGPDGIELGGGWSITKTNGASAQGSFISKSQ